MVGDLQLRIISASARSWTECRPPSIIISVVGFGLAVGKFPLCVNGATFKRLNRGYWWILGRQNKNTKLLPLALLNIRSVNVRSRQLNWWLPTGVSKTSRSSAPATKDTKFSAVCAMAKGIVLKYQELTSKFDVASHRVMQIPSDPLNRSEIIFKINADKWSKIVGHDGLLAKFSVQSL